MKTFLIRYGNNSIEVSDLKEVSVVHENNSLTDYFDCAIRSWYLVVFEKNRLFHLVASADNYDLLEEYRRKIMSAYKKGESEIVLKVI